MSNDEDKFTTRVHEVVDGAERVIGAIGNLISSKKKNKPKEEAMGRKHDDDDNDGIGPTHTTGASVRVGIEGDKLLIQILEADGKVIKQVKLTKEEAEKHGRDLAKKLKALEDD